MTEKAHHICWCPACDEGWVDAVEIQPLELTGRLCAECEAFWPDEQMINEEMFAQLSVLAAEADIALDQLKIVKK